MKNFSDLDREGIELFIETKLAADIVQVDDDDHLYDDLVVDIDLDDDASYLDDDDLDGGSYV